MKIVPLTICFKGSRDYLHGTDMFDCVTNTLATLSPPVATSSDFYLTIHAIARHQCDMHLTESDGEIESRPAGTIVAQFGAARHTEELRGWLVESSRPVQCRMPYREEAIEARCTLKEKSIAHRGESEYTPIEVLVAMTKMLHLALYPSADRRWMFTKLELSRLPLPHNVDGMQVVLLQNLSNRITKSRIQTGVKPLGQIYFSLVNA